MMEVIISIKDTNEANEVKKLAIAPVVGVEPDFVAYKSFGETGIRTQGPVLPGQPLSRRLH